MDVAILGPVRVTGPEGQIDPGGAKERAILATLALRAGTAVGVDELIDAIWGDVPPATATTTLRSHVSRLRRALGDTTILTDPSGYRLDTGDLVIDTSRLEALVAEGAAAEGRGDVDSAREHFADARALWRGEPLVDLADGPVKLGHTARLRALRMRAEDGWIDAELQLGRHEALIPELERMVSEEALHEPRWGQLMLALYRGGRQVDALRAYRRLRGMLGEQLGIEPTPALQRLEWQILRHDPNLDLDAPLPPAGLPQPLTSLVGRADEIEALAAAALEHRVITLHGPAGVGKTRLAIEAAKRIRNRYPDGTFWVDVTSADDLSDVVARLTEVLGAPTQSGEQAIAALAGHLRRRRLLLVIDNAEHVATDLAQALHALLPLTPEVVVLVTSRVVLDVPGEVTFPVGPLEVPDTDTDLGAVARAASVQLFQQRRHPSTADPAPDDLADVAALVRRLEGLPLAIELAAARTRHLTPAGILARLAERAALLDLEPTVAEAPHRRSLRATIEWSYDLLDPSTRHVLRRLAVFPGDFDPDAARSVCGPITVDSDDATEHLSLLVDASMLMATSAPGTPRFRLLAVVREFAAERLAGRGETDDAQRAHADHFRRFAERAGAAIDGAGAGPWWAAVLRERHNISVAVTWTLAHDRARALDFARLLVRTWEQTVPGDAHRAMEVFRAILESSDHDAPDRRGWAWLGIVTPGFLAGEIDEALAASGQAMQLFESAHDDSGAAAAAWMLGSATLLGVGDTEVASDLLRRAVAAAHRCGLPVLEAWATAQLAQSELFGEQPLDEIGAIMDRSEALAEHGLDELQAHLAMNRSYAAYRAGDLEACEAAAVECRERARAAGSPVYDQIGLVGLATVALARGELDRARETALRAAQTALDAANTLQFGISLMLLASIADHAGDHTAAARLWGAGTSRAPTWPFIAVRWFPANAARALGHAFAAEVDGGTAASPRALIDTAIG